MTDPYLGLLLIVIVLSLPLLLVKLNAHKYLWIGLPLGAVWWISAIFLVFLLLK